MEIQYTIFKRKVAFIPIALFFLLSLFTTNLYGQFNFAVGQLTGVSLINPTSLQFGPDGRLYVSQQNGIIKVLTIVREGPNTYTVTSTETITLINSIPNHNDDGSAAASVTTRQVTGILVTGTAADPVLYVGSSDSRIGGPGGNGDANLDTNSGIISRLTKNGSLWEKIDLVRGLPRSEENHSINGLQLDTQTNTMYVAVGGFTNAGAPSSNFAFITEYALSAAIISVDLDAIDAMTTKGTSNNRYKYDLPTLDDPTRTNNADGTDINDPFGGNDGLNQAKIVIGGPVQIYSPGYRTPYDLVITKARRMYVVDNGANQGWGGHPANEGSNGNVTNNYIPGEPGSSSPGPNDDAVNNLNGFEYIGNIDTYVPGSYYGGHPTPIRANPAGAGLYTHTGSITGGVGVWRTSKTGANPLPADWPPVPVSMANPIEGDFQNPGETDRTLINFSPSTNGLAEYTASNFNNALKGDILAAGFFGDIYRINLNTAGTGVLNRLAGKKENQDPAFASGFGAEPLDITTQGDNDIFPGTVWAATYGSSSIVVFEPQDFQPDDCTGQDNANDDDSDGYTNADEIDNNTNPCSAASKPADFDRDLVSNLNDLDDDNDGIADIQDYFALDADNGIATTLPINYDLFNNDPGTGLFGLGFTGLMRNGTTNYLQQFNEDNLIPGGAVGAFSVVDASIGDALGNQNNQENAFQFGINVDSNTEPYTVRARMLGAFFNNQTPANFQSQGVYIGTGDQNNYIKIVLNANGGTPGIEVVYENGGVPVIQQYSIGVLPSQSLDLLLAVNPIAGTVQARYAKNGGTVVSIGSPIAVSGPLLTSIQSTPALAVGIISTSRGATPFTATWDFIHVTYNSNQAPILLNEIPDQNAKVEVNFNFVVADTTFTDENGDNLTYSATLSNNSALPAWLKFNGSTRTFNGIPTSNNPSTINVKVTVNDGKGGTASDIFAISIAPSSNASALYLVNAGGPEINYNGKIWSADQYFTGGETYSNFNIEDIEGTADDDLYKTERNSPTKQFSYNFPVVSPDTYTVKLHFAEIYMGATGGGYGAARERVFDVNIEGGTIELDDFDIYEEIGPMKAVIKTFNVTVTDGMLNINFTATIDQPKISAIEIWPYTGNSEPTLVATPTSVHFFSQQAGTTSTPQTISISNTGMTALNVTGVTITGANSSEFQHDFTASTTIAAGASIPIQLTFTPISLGLKTAQLNITHTGTNPKLTINLTGEGHDNAACSATGSILRELWSNVPGTEVTAIPVNTTPSSVSQLTIFETPGNIGDSYAQRIRGFICPPASGNYTFWIAADDDCELWLSTNDNPANKQRIAFSTSWTGSREWTKYATQKSALIALQAGQKYYIEALHKEGGGGDNLAVGWQLPSGIMERPIAGSRLSPFTLIPTVDAGEDQIISLPTNSVALNGSASGAPVNSYAWSQMSGPNTANFSNATIANPMVSGLIQGTYVFRLSVNQNAAFDEVSVIVNAIPANCSATGSILRELWTNVPGTEVTAIPVNTTPSSVSQLTIFETPGNIGDSYAQRIRGFICPPASGNYTFWIAADDDCELWLSTNDNPANKQRIAFSTSWTGSREWTKYATQKSALIALQAGQKYYIEALHKEGGGGDNLAVGWQLPSGIMERPIAGSRLSPFTLIPTVDAGEDQIISLPTNSVALNGSASGAPVNSYAWSQMSGPNTANFSNATIANPMVSGLIQGTYVFRLSVNQNAAFDEVSVIVNAIPANCSATGSILRELWTNVPGTEVTAIPVNTTPSSVSQLTIFETPGNIGDSYAQRIRGFICPPASGNYTFWIAADDDCELWLSTNDNPANKQRIAFSTSWTGSREWTKYATQKSALIALQAGQKYYIEALHKEGGGGDNLAVGWQLPSGIMERPIAGSRLSPFVNNASARVSNEVLQEEAPGIIAYPNPFSSTITLELKSIETEQVALEIYTSQGTLVTKLYSGEIEANKLYKFTLNGEKLSKGVYMARLVTKKKVVYEKIVLLK
ncbi:choice-of-anchor D domain-containing protein [Rhodocytophaga rosea]|uniref:Choice-of-anchor D domain-containing protein n=1 Tax=Rhodocytophaga rosea TaxID=2704465 RepID=A0A6C0GD39_9BACT|nr:malectin domain-containing carbohydrate-binding protein [Rhodocytophaga rosea]QHT65774.1 choice-of-anchor D domain-containing protein [Rhodocytophaga rosea]